MPRASSNELRAEVQALREENARLRAEVAFLREHPALARGIKGEALIAEVLRAAHASPGAGHDLIATKEQLLVEVKYSALLQGVASRPIRRWVWTKLFGELGKKKYDRLLLVGDTDPRFASQYADPSSPYVIFDLPYTEAVDIVGGIHPGRLSRLHLTTNPSTVKSWRAKVMFEQHQVSVWELRQRYPALAPRAEGET